MSIRGCPGLRSGAKRGSCVAPRRGLALPVLRICLAFSEDEGPAVQGWTLFLGLFL